MLKQFADRIALLATMEFQGAIYGDTTTTQPATGETTKQLINYRTDAGVAVIEMNDPPANTYTYEMNRQLDEAILQGAHG